MGRGRATLNLDDLPTEAQNAVIAAMRGSEVTLLSERREVGTLTFEPAVLQGSVIPPARTSHTEPAIPDGVIVIATAMQLSDAARARLSEGFGSDFVVLDMQDAPDSTDVVLTTPVSPQLIGMLGRQFPRARVIVSEIDDDELDVHQSGPVGRMIDAGAHTYLPPARLGVIAAAVRENLTTDRLIEAAASEHRRLSTHQPGGPTVTGEIGSGGPAPGQREVDDAAG